VQAVELLCTAGLPALYTRILMMHQLDQWVIMDTWPLQCGHMLTTFCARNRVITMSQYRQEREGRWLLISGIVMVGLSVVMIVKPDWLM
jgi:hypothetical protein